MVGFYFALTLGQIHRTTWFEDVSIDDFKKKRRDIGFPIEMLQSFSVQQDERIVVEFCCLLEVSSR